MVRYKSMGNKIRKVYVWMNSECIKFVQNKLLPKREMPTKTGTSMLTIWYILLMKIEEVLFKVDQNYIDLPKYVIIIHSIRSGH